MKDNTNETLGYFQKDPSVTTIYTGNLNYETSAKDLQSLFEKFGKVKYVNIVKDKETNKKTGIAFIQMPNGKHAKAAINELNGSELRGRTLKVSVAKNRIPTLERKGAEKAEVKKEVESKPAQKPKRKKGLKLLFDHLGKS